MVKEHFNGKMNKFTKVNGWMEKSMAVECGKVYKVKVTSDNGSMANHKVLVSMFLF